MKNLVTVDWLRTHLNDSDLTIIDCTNGAAFEGASGVWRTESGAPGWRDARIPGSRHADFTTDLAGCDSRYRNALPEPATFVRAVSQLGVAPGRRVILYDRGLSMWAARLWWMLRWIGFDAAWLLDGGLEAWLAGGHPLESGEVTPPRPEIDTQLDISLRPECFVDLSAVRSVLGDPGVVLIDSLSREQFNGQAKELGLCGHIPGAINIPAADLIDQETHRFSPPDVLRSRFPKDRWRPVITYCGSGVAAASTAFCLNQLGYDQVAIYMPGFQEWAQTPDAKVSYG